LKNIYDFKPKDKVIKWYPAKETYETQHKNTTEPKVYTVQHVSNEGVTLYGVPYILFKHDGSILNLDHRKCVNIKVANRLTGTKPYLLWSDAMIVPLETYNNDEVYIAESKDSSDIMQTYEDKVYQW
jgi:hypothetical protein